MIDGLFHSVAHCFILYVTSATSEAASAWFRGWTVVGDDGKSSSTACVSFGISPSQTNLVISSHH